MEERKLTFGEKAVGITFNPSKNEGVERVKTTFAELIDTISAIEAQSSLGAMLKTIAIQSCIVAQMAVVKVITYKD